MNLNSLRRRCEARARSLRLPEPFDVRLFADALATSRGRPIFLKPVVSQAGPWGLWAATSSADYIFFESDTTPLHQEHMILHELSHLICGHRSLSTMDPALREELFPDLSAKTLRRVLGRAAYTSADEQEAEFLASVLLERIASSRHSEMPLASAQAPDSAEILYRLATTLQADPEERP
jgi:hypothetical protein